MENFVQFIHGLYVFTAVAILIYATDDLLLDIYYWISKSWRWIEHHNHALTLEKLNAYPEQRIALMVPCWQESTVVADMLANTINSIHYQNYDIFIGVYPNDEVTHDALAPLLQKHSRVHMVNGKRPGPTTKADNLNTIYAGVHAYEQRTGVQFDLYVMHDAEDVIHPVSFKLYNYLMPAKDMVQIPVFPMESKLGWFTHWSYADEFAENHTKDLIAREWIGGFVPSAGVGTAFSRKALMSLEKETGETLFNAQTLTEDYAFSLFLNRHGLTAVFVQQSIRRLKTKPMFKYFGPKVVRNTKEWIATRSLFPTTYKTAIRQKSRWILGIALQEWKVTGWSGDKNTRYSLLRDRKAPIGYVLIICAYVVFAYWCFYHVSRWWMGHEVVPPLPPINHTLFILITISMIHRLLERAVAVGRIYGVAPALLSIPRTVYLNVVNVHAFLRALSLFLRAEKKREPVAWAKTVNHFPTPTQMAPLNRTLGDTLIENSFASVAEVEHALNEQQHNKRPLGRILKEQGIVSEDHLLTSLGKLLDIQVAASQSLAAAHGELPLELKNFAASLGAVWLETSDNTLLFAIDDNADPVAVEAFRHVDGKEIRFVLAREADLRQLAISAN